MVVNEGVMRREIDISCPYGELRVICMARYVKKEVEHYRGECIESFDLNQPIDLIKLVDALAKAHEMVSGWDREDLNLKTFIGSRCGGSNYG